MNCCNLFVFCWLVSFANITSTRLTVMLFGTVVCSFVLLLCYTIFYHFFTRALVQAVSSWGYRHSCMCLLVDVSPGVALPGHAEVHVHGLHEDLPNRFLRWFHQVPFPSGVTTSNPSIGDIRLYLFDKGAIHLLLLFLATWHSLWDLSSSTQD